MNKKYKYKFSKIMLALIFSILVILLIGIIVNVLAIFELGNLFSESKTINIVSTVLMLFILVLDFLILIFTGYKLGKTDIVYTVSLIFYKISYSDILLLRRNEDMLLVYYKDSVKGVEEIRYSSINIKKEYFDDFMSTVKDYNNDIVLEDYRDKDMPANENIGFE